MSLIFPLKVMASVFFALVETTIPIVHTAKNHFQMPAHPRVVKAVQENSNEWYPEVSVLLFKPVLLNFSQNFLAFNQKSFNSYPFKTTGCNAFEYFVKDQIFSNKFINDEIIQ